MWEIFLNIVYMVDLLPVLPRLRVNFNNNHILQNTMSQASLTKHEIDNVEFGYSHEDKVEFTAIFEDETDLRVSVNFNFDVDEGYIYFWENNIVAVSGYDWNTEANTNAVDLDKMQLVREFLATDFVKDAWLDVMERNAEDNF